MRQKPGIEIKRRRSLAKLSLRALGEAAGVDKQAVYRIEHGQWGDADTIERLAVALGCTTHDLEYPEVPAPRQVVDGAPLDAETYADGTIAGRTLESWETPALRRESDAEEVVLPAAGAGERWFATRLGPVTPDMVSRDTTGAPWRIDEGDIIIFRPAEPGEVPHDAIVIVSYDDPDSEGLPVRREVRIAKRSGNRTALHPVGPDAEPVFLKRDWDVIAIGVEVRQLLEE